MELRIGQALQQGVKLLIAEKINSGAGLYCYIWQKPPKHPDTKHKFGSLTFSLNKLNIALTLFVKAIEANSSHWQFWSSYVNTLIKANQLYSFKYVIAQERMDGLARKKLLS